MKLEAKSLPKGMLQFSKETQFQQQIGHSVVHLTDLSFTENEIELLNKDLPSNTFSTTTMAGFQKILKNINPQTFFP